MMVYVDDMAPCRPNSKWRWAEACHLFTDGSLEELHAFAEKLGLKRSWFQSHPRLPHYDLTRNKRRQAIQLGAIPVNLREYLRSDH